MCALWCSVMYPPPLCTCGACGACGGVHAPDAHEDEERGECKEGAHLRGEGVEGKGEKGYWVLRGGKWRQGECATKCPP